MSDDKFGDNEFKEFIGGDDDGEKNTESQCPGNGVFFIVSVIGEKMSFINKQYKESLIHYDKIQSTDPFKETLRKYLEDLMIQSTQAIDQLDFALIDSSDDVSDSPENIK